MGTEVCTPARFEQTSAGATTGVEPGDVVVGAGVADAGVHVVPAAT